MRTKYRLSWPSSCSVAESSSKRSPDERSDIRGFLGQISPHVASLKGGGNIILPVLRGVSSAWVAGALRAHETDLRATAAAARVATDTRGHPPHDSDLRCPSPDSP